MTALFDWLFRRRRSAPTAPPPAFLCSGCYQVKNSTEMHALPWWNPDERAFFMSIRCAECFPNSLGEARTRVRAWDREAERAFRAFLKTWRIESHLPELSGLAPQAKAEAVLEHVERTSGRTFAAVFHGQTP